MRLGARYLVEIGRNIGFAFATYSLYALMLILTGDILLMLRTGIEERMLVEEFGV